MTDRQLPELVRTPFGSYATTAGPYQVELVGQRQIDLNLGDGDAVAFSIDQAEEAAYALLAAVRHTRQDT